MAAILALALVEACALPAAGAHGRAELMPQPPTQVYVAGQRQVRRRRHAAGVVGGAALPVMNMYFAIRLAS